MARNPPHVLGSARLIVVKSSACLERMRMKRSQLTRGTTTRKFWKFLDCLSQDEQTTGKGLLPEVAVSLRSQHAPFC